MTHADELWNALRHSLSGDCWTPLHEIYRLVEIKVSLDHEDFLPAAPGVDEPKWRRNVRNVLQRQKILGGVLWNGRGSYRLP
jgi:hypothetical protein